MLSFQKNLTRAQEDTDMVIIKGQMNGKFILFLDDLLILQFLVLNKISYCQINM